jgi:hypothetical protein
VSELRSLSTQMPPQSPPRSAPPVTGCAGFLSPYYSEAHSGQERTRSIGARVSCRGAPRFRPGYARARCEWAMRTGAFQGDGNEGQTICNYCSMNSARCKGSGILVPFFFSVPAQSAPATLTPSWRNLGAITREMPSRQFGARARAPW